MPAPRKRGRKPVDPAKKKSKDLHFPVEPAIYRAFCEVAKLLGLSASQAGREAMLLWLKTVEWEASQPSSS
jgi:hypothetical protein